MQDLPPRKPNWEVIKAKRYKELNWKRFIEPDEAKSFLGSFTEQEKRYKTCFFFLLCSGIRPIDALRIQLTNLSKDFKQVIYYQQKTGKANTVELIDPLAEMLKEYVTEWISHIIKSEEYLFFSESNNGKKHWTTSALRRIMTIKRKELGLNHSFVNPKSGKRHYRFNVYSLRRLFATTLNKVGGLEFVKWVLGHSNLATTSRYIGTHFASDEARRIQTKALTQFFEVKTLPSSQKRLCQFD